MVALNFSTQGVAPNAALEAVPSGTYDCTITRTEEKPTKDGGGSYIEFEFTIGNNPDQKLNGRKVFDRLNIKNKSQQAVEIAYGTLSAICHVLNRHQIQDTGQLHGIPLKVVVVKQERSDRPGSGEYTNEVKGYKDINGNDPGQSGQGAAGGGGYGGPQQGAQGGGAPWANQGGGTAGQQQGGPQQGAPWQGGPQQGNGQQGGPAAPHQGANGQQYPDPAHNPNPGQGAPGGPQTGAAQAPPWGANGGGAPQQDPNAGQNQGGQQGAPQQAFTPQQSPPWANNGQR